MFIKNDDRYYNCIVIYLIDIVVKRIEIVGIKYEVVVRVVYLLLDFIWECDLAIRRFEGEVSMLGRGQRGGTTIIVNNNDYNVCIDHQFLT